VAKALKIFAIVLGVIVLGVVVLAIALVLLVDPNDYKGEITQAVKDNTGRELKIKGNLGLSVFPWVGLEIGEAELANAPGFGDTPFARITSAGVRVKVLPLLHKELVVDSVHVDGLRLDLARNRAGRTNWEDLAAAEKPAAAAKGKPRAPAAPSETGLAAFTIGGINISNGEIRWRDEQAGTRYTLSNLELKSSTIDMARPVDAHLAFLLESATPALRAPIELNTRVQLNLERQTLDIPKLELAVAELVLKANLKGTNIRQSPVLQGQLEIPAFDPRPLLKTLGAEPRMASKDALHKLALSAQFRAELGRQALALSDIAVTIDDMVLHANLRGDTIVDAPKWSGSLSLPSFHPATVLDLLAINTQPSLRQAFAQASLKADFNADLQQHTISIANLSLAADGLTLTGDLQASNIGEAPVIQGRVEMPSFNPRKLLQALGIEYQPASKEVLRTASLKSAFSADLGHQAVAVSQLALAVDDIALHGELAGTRIVDAPRWSGRVELPGFPPGALLTLLTVDTRPAWTRAFARAALKADFSADLPSQTLDVADLSLTADELQINGDLQARDLRKAAQVRGHVAIAPVDARRLLAKLAVHTQTADGSVLRRVAVRSDFKGSAQQLVLDKLDMRLDDSRVTGSLAVRNFSKPAYAFDLKLDQIDLDRYLPPATSPAQASAGKVAAVAPGAAPAALPISTLRALDVDGQAAIGKLKAFGLRAADALIKINAKGGVLTLGPNKAAFYDGRYDGSTVIDVRAQAPQYQINERLSDLELGPFLKDAAIYDKLSGKGNLVLDLRARGFDAEGITNTLSGKTTLAVKSGKLEGVNLQKLINDARTKYNQLRGKPVPVLPDASDSTVFKSLTATANLTNGIASNDDLKLDGANLRATGKGTVNLPKQTINYRLNVTVTEEAGGKGTTVPVDISGKVAEPTYNVAWNEVLKDQLKKEVDQRKEQEKQKLEDKLKDRLKKKYKF
jgi:AsmA protein